METAVQTQDETLDITGLDTVSCKNVQAVIQHEKFEQFLRIFNMHREREHSESGDGAYEAVTMERLLSDQGTIEEAADFVEKKLLTRGSQVANERLQEITEDMFSKLMERAEALEEAQEALTETFD